MSVPDAEYRQLSEFRFRIREFLQFSVSAARGAGLEPQQHQLLLAIKGLASGQKPTIRTLSTRLCLRHNSTVELIDRLVKRGAIVRRNSEEDRREVLVELTPLGETLLEQVSERHLQHLRSAGPTLTKALQAIIADGTASESIAETQVA